MAVDAIANPYLISGPACVGFSGGRTSAYMLRKIIDAHGGVLPDDIRVCFENTGREMPATLDFVRECGARWGVRIDWLEYTRTETGPGFALVSHNSASRHGEPFEKMISGCNYLPNPVTRFCTSELKLRTQKRFLLSLGWEHWVNVVGLRADEPKRVARALDQNTTKKDRWTNVCPLNSAGVTEEDVMAFWHAQDFDLRLAGAHEGNCDGCFLKSRSALSRMFYDPPARMAWWPKMEAADRESYAQMARTVRDQGTLPFDLDTDQTLPYDLAACGG